MNLKKHASESIDKHNFEALFGLRAFAAFWVISFHVYFFWHILNNKFVRSAVVAPDMFFILSGFILSYHYYKLFNQKIRTKQYMKYITKRFFRVWPGLLFIYLIGILVYWVLIENSSFPGNTNLTFNSFMFSLLLIITMTYVWFSQNRIEMRNLLWDKVNVSLWTVSAEWFSYLLFPFVCFFANRLPWKLILSITTLLWLSLGFVASKQPEGLMHCLYGYTALLRSFSDFFMGVTTCLIFFKLKPSRSQRNLFTCASLLILSVLIYLDVVSIQFLMLPFLGLLILGFTAKHRVSQFFSHPIMIYFGEISYSVYLVHWLVLNMFHYFLTHEVIDWHLSFFSRLPSLVESKISYESFFLFGFFSTVIIFAIFVYHFIEKPCRAYFLKKILG